MEKNSICEPVFVLTGAGANSWTFSELLLLGRTLLLDMTGKRDILILDIQRQKQ